MALMASKPNLFTGKAVLPGQAYVAHTWQTVSLRIPFSVSLYTDNSISQTLDECYWSGDRKE